jgi:DNA-binding transcriptional regulator PaaX
VVREAAATYRIPSPFYGGAYYDTVKGIMDIPSTFTMAVVTQKFPSVPEGTIRRALQDLKKEGKLSSHRAGRKSYWEKLKNENAGGRATHLTNLQPKGRAKS